jgi:hypothetical protein
VYGNCHIAVATRGVKLVALGDCDAQAVLGSEYDTGPGHRGVVDEVMSGAGAEKSDELGVVDSEHV